MRPMARYRRDAPSPCRADHPEVEPVKEHRVIDYVGVLRPVLRLGCIAKGEEEH